ncbi:acyl-CoA dehydrogenase family protein [Sphingomonas oligophenolica]|uniref:Acyl-CoA dehydrogenase family protein n=1 Tax=Sphingomonas oligophenolica TaxID=301154 RepID=A0ABU9Y686_9SPHN
MRELFETTAHKLFAEHVACGSIATAEEGAWPAALWAAVEEAGLPLALAAEARGGVGARWADTVDVALCAGALSVPAPVCETMLGNWLLSRAGIDAVAGPIGICDRHNLVIANGRASGVADAVPFGRHSDHVIAVTADSGQPTVLLLAAGDADVRASLNIAREPRDRLSFRDAPVAASVVLPQGSDAAILRLGGALMRSAQMAGALGTLVDESVGYANERSQFGRTIGKFQAIQHQLAVLAEQASIARAAVEQAFGSADAGLNRFDVAVAKIVCGEAAGTGSAIAHAVHGAIGFTYEHSLHFATRRLWSWRDEHGSEARWAQELGEAACRGGGDALWPSVTCGGFPASAGA